MTIFLIFPTRMEYDISRKLSPEETAKFCCGKNKKTFNRQFARSFKSGRLGKEEINITNILSAELAESVLDVSILLAQTGSSSEWCKQNTRY